VGVEIAIAPLCSERQPPDSPLRRSGVCLTIILLIHSDDNAPVVLVRNRPPQHARGKILRNLGPVL